ncbi:hypothetical protein AAHC03_09434 [Spirometra sp. Aus1]
MGSDRGAPEYGLERSDLHQNKDNQKSCDFAANGFRYQNGQVWMSPDSPCIQCRCTNGEVDCSSNVLHCRSVCLPNQETIHTGPCCEQKCIDKENFTNQTPSSCLGLTDQVIYHHGDIQIRREECVDRHCQCINGDWFCLDFCTPLENLTCSREERIYWDKFCCPRCRGQKSCSISVPSSSWTDSPPGRSPRQLFVSLTERDQKMDKVRGLRLSQRVRRQATVHLPSPTLQAFGHHGIRLVHIEPGLHVAYTDGRCVCLDGEFRCSRPDPGIWHDTDCYYSDGDSGEYYALGSQWTAHNDACIQCRCLAGRTYACSRTPCHSLFLCPAGQTAVAANGECCPTHCVDIDEDRNRTHQTRPAIKPRIPPHPVRFSTDKIADSMGDVFQPPNSARRCKPLGYPHSDNALDPYLPVKSAVIIRRPCIDLQCVCQPTGHWMCADHCSPCPAGKETVSDQNDYTSAALGADGCCLPCAATASWTTNNHSGTGHLTAALERYTRTVTICLILLICIPSVAMCVCCLCPLSKIRVMHTAPKFPSKRRTHPNPGLKHPPATRMASATVPVASTDLDSILEDLAGCRDTFSKRLSIQNDSKLASSVSMVQAQQSEVKATELPTISLTCPSNHASKLSLSVSQAASERESWSQEPLHKLEDDPILNDQPQKFLTQAKNRDTLCPLPITSLNGPHRPSSTQSRPPRPSTLPGSVAGETGLRPVQHYFVHLPSVRLRSNTIQRQNGLTGTETSCLQTPNEVETRTSKSLHVSSDLPDLSPVPPPKPPIPNFRLTDKDTRPDSVFSVTPPHIDFSAVTCSHNELAPYCTGV